MFIWLLMYFNFFAFWREIERILAKCLIKTVKRNGYVCPAHWGKIRDKRWEMRFNRGFPIPHPD